MAWFATRGPNREWKWGYINQQGQVVIQPQFGQVLDQATEDNILKWGGGTVGDFQEGLAITPPGFMNRQGQIVIPQKYKSSVGFLEGVAAVQDSRTGNWGLIDQQGQWLVPSKFVDLGLFESSSRFAQLNDEKKTLVIVSRNGKVTPLDGRIELSTDFQEGFAGITFVGNISEFYYINDRGEKLFSFPLLKDMHKFSEGLAGVAIDISEE
jgi:hypothetical protein